MPGKAFVMAFVWSGWLIVSVVFAHPWLSRRFLTVAPQPGP